LACAQGCLVAKVPSFLRQGVSLAVFQKTVSGLSMASAERQGTHAGQTIRNSVGRISPFTGSLHKGIGIPDDKALS
jgi:hypothetical protein